MQRDEEAGKVQLFQNWLGGLGAPGTGRRGPAGSRGVVSCGTEGPCQPGSDISRHAQNLAIMSAAFGWSMRHNECVMNQESQNQTLHPMS